MIPSGGQEEEVVAAEPTSSAFTTFFEGLGAVVGGFMAQVAEPLRAQAAQALMRGFQREDRQREVVSMSEWVQVTPVRSSSSESDLAIPSSDIRQGVTKSVMDFLDLEAAVGKAEETEKDANAAQRALYQQAGVSGIPKLAVAKRSASKYETKSRLPRPVLAFTPTATASKDKKKSRPKKKQEQSTFEQPRWNP